MAQFIQRVCDKKKIDVTTTEIRELSWRFSGDTGNGRKESIQQTWKNCCKSLKAESPASWGEGEAWGIELVIMSDKVIYQTLLGRY